MTERFLGEIQVFGFTFAPYQWASCSGQIMPINQNTALFSLLGNNFGGDGRTTFALPNLASLQVCGAGQGPGLSPRTIGEQFGAYTVTLTTAEMPMHNHGINAYSPNGDEVVQPSATAALGPVSSGNFSLYGQPGTAAMMAPMFIQPSGGGQPHMNSQPYLGVNFCIALEGVYPSFQ